MCDCLVFQYEIESDSEPKWLLRTAGIVLHGVCTCLRMVQIASMILAEFDRLRSEAKPPLRD